MANRKRDQAMYFMVTPRERQLIAEKMAQLGTKNTGAYLRKMAVDGYIVKLDLGSVRELVGLLRGATNNLNQIARRANERLRRRCGGYAGPVRRAVGGGQQDTAGTGAN